MRNKLMIGLFILAAGLHVPHGVSAQHLTSAVCLVQATVVPRVTVSTMTIEEGSISQAPHKRTALILSGEGVLQLKVDSEEPFEAATIELKQESKEINHRAFSRINKMRLEYLSS